MTNNQSKRQQNCRGNLRLLAGRRSVPVLALIILMTVAGCSDGPSTGSCRKADEALGDYASFYRSLSRKGALSSQELVSTVKAWKALDDSVSIAVFRDSCHTGRFANDSTYTVLRDSILGKILELVDSRKRTLKDYLNVVVAANGTKPDSTSQQFALSVHKFYANADSVPAFKLGSRETIHMYERILSDASRNGLRSKRDVFTFLRDEDRAFRSFLVHLPDLGDVSLADVRDMSALLMKDMVELAQGERPVLTAGEVAILLTMRNNRRLIQNALQCVNDINARKVKGKDQSAAYMWMLLQPWVSFDGCAYSLMSDAQMDRMNTLAAETPKSIAKLGKVSFPIDTEELPSLLIKTALANRATQGHPINIP